MHNGCLPYGVYLVLGKKPCNYSKYCCAMSCTKPYMRPPLKSKRRGFRELPGWWRRMPPHATVLGSKLQEDWIFFVLDLTLWISSSGCWFLCFNILSNKQLICRVADRVLVLWPGVRPEPLRWESQVQDIGPPETSWTHIISISKSNPRDLHLNAKTQLHPMAYKLQCWRPMPNN